MHDLINVILLGILEGLTEFLPVSSTGHLFLLEKFLGVPLEGDSPEAQFWLAFGIVIQIGAILAVVVYFRDRIIDLLLGRTPAESTAAAEQRTERQTMAVAAAASRNGGRNSASGLAPGTAATRATGLFAVDPFGPARPRQVSRYHALWMIAVGTIPIYVTGLVVGKISERLESSAIAISAALIIGGILMWVIERLPVRIKARRMEEMTWQQAMTIGCTQILAATFPGTSRSAATIMPGLAAGLSRPAATEFSFFLAIPAMFAACGYKMLKWVLKNHPNTDQLLLMALGTVVSFMVAWVVIAAFMTYIRRHTFVTFAVYRIIFGGIVLFWAVYTHPGHVHHH